MYPMKLVLSRRVSALGLSAGIAALGSGLVACGSSTTSSGTANTNTNTNTTTGTGTTTNESDAGVDASSAGTATDASAVITGACPPAGYTAACAAPVDQIDFTPMYSAFIPGSTAHVFSIPAITDDGNPGTTWCVGDSTQAILAPQSFNNLPGVMITVQGVGANSDGDAGELGTIQVYALENDGTCGASTLTITATTEAEWTLGSQRYNDDITLTGTRTGEGALLTGTGDAGSVYEKDGGTACTNCHGPTATTGPYRQVAHSPEQTGGFSDQVLVGIFTQGNVPGWTPTQPPPLDGGYWDPSVINAACDAGPPNYGPNQPTRTDPLIGAASDGGTEPCGTWAYDTWHSFHQWSDISTPQEQAAIITYLRAITPESQNGTPAENFGGRGAPGDGGARGRRDGGFPFGDGGFPFGDGGFPFGDGGFPFGDGGFPGEFDATMPAEAGAPDTGASTPDTGADE
jgi:hypothetical protein